MFLVQLRPVVVVSIGSGERRKGSSSELLPIAKCCGAPNTARLWMWEGAGEDG